MSDAPVFTHTLREPIKNMKGEEVTEISFRKPRGGDIMRHGYPVRYVPGQDVETVTIDGEKAAQMMAELSGIPLPMIERMDPNDMTDCAWGIAGFFIQGFNRARSSSPAAPSA